MRTIMEIPTYAYFNPNGQLLCVDSLNVHLTIEEFIYRGFENHHPKIGKLLSSISKLGCYIISIVSSIPGFFSGVDYAHKYN